MTRILIQVAVPLLLPTLLYFGYVYYLRRKDPNAEITVTKPWFRLIAAGLLLVVISLVSFAVFTGEKPGGRYVPPTVVDGEIVPGHIIRDEPTTEETPGDERDGQNRQ